MDIDHREGKRKRQEGRQAPSKKTRTSDAAPARKAKAAASQVAILQAKTTLMCSRQTTTLPPALSSTIGDLSDYSGWVLLHMASVCTPLPAACYALSSVHI